MDNNKPITKKKGIYRRRLVHKFFVKLDGDVYRMYNVIVFADTPREQKVTIASEELDNKIQELIAADRYVGEARRIDEMYAYVVPESEESSDEDIINSIEDIID